MSTKRAKPVTLFYFFLQENFFGPLRLIRHKEHILFSIINCVCRRMFAKSFAFAGTPAYGKK